MKNRKLRILITDLAFASLMLILFVMLLLSYSLSWGETTLNVFMVLILAHSLLASFYPLTSKHKTTLVEWIVIVFCVSLLAAAIIIFASLATGQLREPFIQISAAFLGGLITLYGVGLTIKYNRLEREEDEIKKARPNVFTIGDQTWYQLDEKAKSVRRLEIRPDLSNVLQFKKNEARYKIAPIYLANSDLSMCTINGIVINDNCFIVFQYDNIMLKGSNNCFVVDFCFKLDSEIKTVQLVLGDMLGNIYGCYVSFEPHKDGRGKTTELDIKGVLNMKTLDTDKYIVFKKPNQK